MARPISQWPSRSPVTPGIEQLTVGRFNVGAMMRPDYELANKIAAEHSRMRAPSAELDEILKESITSLKLDRDRAKTALTGSGTGRPRISSIPRRLSRSRHARKYHHRRHPVPKMLIFSQS
jgi:hypothetical protein